ncbi:MAG: hypothetical protein V4658_00600 [Bacteroidota bacterium]
MLNTICEAISSKSLLALYYDGGVRVVEPHCYGITEDGNHGLQAFQVRGHSTSDTMGWKLFDLGRAANIVILEEPFWRARPDYKRGEGMSRIYCELVIGV